MAIRVRAQLQEWFKKGKYPKQEHFYDFFDSYWHKEEDIIPMSTVENLTKTLNNKYDVSDAILLEARVKVNEENIDRHEKFIDEIFEELAEHEEWLEEHDKRLDKHDTRLDGHDQDVKDLKYQDTQHDLEIAFLQDDVAKLQAADETIKKDITDLQKADADIRQNITAVTTRVGTLETTSSNHAERIDTAEKDIVKLYQTDSGFKEEIAELRAQITSLLLEGKIIPLNMSLSHLETITLGNEIIQKIEAVLRPDYVVQNVLFLGDDRAVKVLPDGTIEVLKVGKSTIHVIPTENTSLYKTIEIEVVLPAPLMATDAGIFLDADGTIFLT